MIHKVHIQNFKSLRDVSIDLERFTAFVGANGSGKTSVLEAIYNAVRAATGDAQKVFAHERHGDWIYTRGGLGNLSIRCETSGGAFSVEATPPKGYLGPELMHLKGRWDYRTTASGAPLHTALGPARRTVFLRLNAAVMARPSYSLDDPPRVHRPGASVSAGVHGAERPARVPGIGRGRQNAYSQAPPDPVSQGDRVSDRERAGEIRQ